MTLELSTLVAATVGYLLLLFAVAHAALHRPWAARLARHPLAGALALGVYATSWSYFGSVGYASRHGFRYLAIYLGATLSCLLVPVLWRPLWRLTQELQLTSLADVLAFRYPGQATGTLVTLLLLASSLPYLALQVRAVIESARVLAPSTSATALGLGFCATAAVFSTLFGARHLTPRERHEGLVLAIAFESLVKVLALLVVGGWVLFSVFGGPSGLQAWLAAHPEALEAMHAPAREASWAPLLVLSCIAAFLVPRQFHVAFTESTGPQSLTTSAWAFPLLLLAMNLAVPPLVWAGTALGLPGPADFHVLALPLSRGQPLLALTAFVGGISASSAMVIVTTLALAPMCLTYLVLPLRSVRGRMDLYRWLLWARRILIAAMIMAGWGFYRLLDARAGSLVDLGLVSFVGVAQLAPGLLGLLYWPRATRAGLLAGLLAGGAVWVALLLPPLWAGPQALPTALGVSLGFSADEPWGFATFASLTLNVLAFVAVSLATRPSTQEAEAARLCTRDLPLLASGSVEARSPEEFRDQLAPLIGSGPATAEVARAMEALGLGEEERRPAELRRLRDQVERNLSGLIGPVLAQLVVSEALRMDPLAQPALAEQLRLLEERLGREGAMSGPLRELEGVRRYLQRVLEELPLGACALGPARDVVIWNAALERLSGVAAAQVRSLPLASVQEPWGALLTGFLEGVEAEAEVRVQLSGRERTLRLYRSLASSTEAPQPQGAVLLVEDITERKALESRLAHQDRLASVGRVAAGVAHEIGNPLTAITSLAQNMRHEEDMGEVRERVALILQQSQRINAIVRTLITFSHAGSAGEVQVRFGPVRLAPLLGEAAQIATLARKGRNVQCVCTCPESLEVTGDAQRLEQVVVNLVTNAMDASPPGSLVEVEAEQVGEQVLVRVMDRGSGIPPQLLERIFEPFFTTKQPGEGTGLGLSLASSIVREHSGLLEVTDRPGGGTSMVVRLPAAQRTAAAGPRQVRE
jgi:signal transduction histidine kinase/Na+/proline symporter